MNHGILGGAQKQSASYASAQSALSPVAESLQVDSSMDSISKEIEFHAETVRALLRRLEPVTGALANACGSDCEPQYKVPLAARIDYCGSAISALTGEVQHAIRNLQI